VEFTRAASVRLTVAGALRLVLVRPLKNEAAKKEPRQFSSPEPCPRPWG
jgi:hypothetical protein